mmetsp:Transcript_5052/g.10985  ORF Transcript_5052/g.10985 Transcript_5052/m.10985 type:complete len:287 (+) Transcript_5052:1789-2649(+)
MMLLAGSCLSLPPSLLFASPFPPASPRLVLVPSSIFRFSPSFCPSFFTPPLFSACLAPSPPSSSFSALSRRAVALGESRLSSSSPPISPSSFSPSLPIFFSPPFFDVLSSPPSPSPFSPFAVVPLPPASPFTFSPPPPPAPPFSGEGGSGGRGGRGERGGKAASTLLVVGGEVAEEGNPSPAPPPPSPSRRVTDEDGVERERTTYNTPNPCWRSFSHCPSYTMLPPATPCTDSYRPHPFRLPLLYCPMYRHPNAVLYTPYPCLTSFSYSPSYTSCGFDSSPNRYRP